LSYCTLAVDFSSAFDYKRAHRSYNHDDAN
jgi:hypothetical protein